MRARDEGRRMPDQGDGTYMNPILGGDYPDPSVLRVGRDYYMTHSSFNYGPGLLIWHSRDLVNWQPVCHAATGYPGNVWAPDFIEHDGHYYIYYPSFYKSGGHSNWVVHAPSPTGPWSAPIDLHVSHIDPGHVVDPDGRRYLMLSGGHLVPLTDDGLATDGEPEKVYDGWPLPEDWVIECFALESPKFTFVDGWYYLTVAEGGTAGPATSHSVVQSRSRTPWGPWEHNPHNPLVHTSSREERWWSRGHGTLVDTPDGRWYVMYHAYEKDYHTLGRQTLLEPLERTDDGWFRPVDDLDIAGPIPVPPGEAVEHGLALSDDLCGTEPGLQWRFQEPSPWTHERPGMQRVNCTPEGLQMQAEGTCPADSRPMLCIPVDRAYEVSVEVEATAGCTPALMLYYSPECYTALCAATDEQGSPEVRLWRRNRPFGSERCAAPARALRITNDHHEIRFGYDAGDGWKTIQRAIQTDGYHHNVFGGFISLRAGLGTFGEGAARFRSFRYRAL